MHQAELLLDPVDKKLVRPLDRVCSRYPAGLHLEFCDLGTTTVPTERTLKLTTGWFKIQFFRGHSNGNVHVGGYVGHGQGSSKLGRRNYSNDENLFNQVEAILDPRVNEISRALDDGGKGLLRYQSIIGLPADRPSSSG